MNIKTRANNFDTLPPSKALPGGCSCCSCCCCVHGVSLGVGISVGIAKSHLNIYAKIILSLAIIAGLAFAGIYLDLMIGALIIESGKAIGVNSEAIGMFVYIVSAVLLGISGYKITDRILNKKPPTNEVIQYSENKKIYHKQRIKIHSIVIGFFIVFNIIIDSLLKAMFNSLFNELYILITLANFSIAYLLFLKLDNNVSITKDKIVVGILFVLSYYLIPSVIIGIMYYFNFLSFEAIYIISFLGYILSAFVFEYIYFIYMKNYANKE